MGDLNSRLQMQSLSYAFVKFALDDTLIFPIGNEVGTAEFIILIGALNEIRNGVSHEHSFSNFKLANDKKYLQDLVGRLKGRLNSQHKSDVLYYLGQQLLLLRLKQLQRRRDLRESQHRAGRQPIPGLQEQEKLQEKVEKKELKKDEAELESKIEHDYRRLKRRIFSEKLVLQGLLQQTQPEQQRMREYIVKEDQRLQQLDQDFKQVEWKLKNIESISRKALPDAYRSQ